MSIDFDDNLIALWYVELPTECNWMAGLSRTANNTGQVKYRFRYYVDQKTHDSQDIKHWYAWQGDFQQLMAATDGVYRHMIAQGGGTHYHLERGTRTTQQIMREFMTWHVSHAKVISKEEFDRLKGKSHG